MKNVKEIKCEICEGKFKTIGLSTHLKSKHSGLTVDEYVDRFGEFRINQLKKVNPKSENCLVCSDDTKYTIKGITWHIKREHNLDKLEYVRRFILKNNIPLCKCGCGEEINIVHYKPYIVREYLSGHNSKGESNPRYGVNIKQSTRDKMKEKAISRIETYHKNNEVPPFLTDEIKEKRIKNLIDGHLQKIEKENDIKIINYFSEKPNVYYELMCTLCNTKFEQFHRSYFKCPKCNKSYRSNVEVEVIDYIKSLNPDIILKHNDRNVLTGGMELDIYLPEYNFAIEFNGLYWHGELNGKDKKYHLNKTKQCNEKGIHLIHIFEDEWLNYQNVVKNRIGSKIGNLNIKRIYARQCEIKNVSWKDSFEFLNLYHLQGSDSSPFRYGLYYNDELVSLMTFSKQNASRGVKDNIDGVFELSRFVVKDDISCVGAAGKLFKRFIKNNNPHKIISYADRRWSDNNKNLYITLGFDFDGYTSPSYWYFKSNDKRYHRFNFTKKKTIEMGGDSFLTEWQNMQSFGYDRIWDCGHMKYMWSNPQTV